ncbi:MAG: alpha/beta hydrolase fold domain-containing protein [Acidobacteria bacterium]|nr:alpha/beta hydrolase fold domain-containing protein [Acidobacteriota bacterium]
MRAGFSIMIATLFSILLFAVSHNAQEVRRITYNNVSVDVVIDKPANYFVDVLIAFPGTVATDDQTLPAARNILQRTKEITNRTDMMIVSVAYPQEGRLMGDSIAEAEAALLWVKEKSRKELKRKVRKIFLIGHSQGGYMVTRLNTMHPTDGVISNGPGPLNLVYRCGLEENGQAPPTAVCATLRQTYGTTVNNPAPYMARSLLSFTEGYRSDILFVQGLQDSPIQLASWPTFKQQVTDCTNCQNRQIVEIANAGHTALFESPEAINAYNAFINR